MSYIVRFQDYFTEVGKQPDKLLFDIRDFLFSNWLLIIFIYFYYGLCVNFLGEALLLFQDGENGVPQFYDWFFALTDPAIEVLSFWLPVLFSLVVFGGIYYLKSGSFNPKESDRITQYLSVWAVFPFILYFVLQLIYLNHVDKSWYFDLEYMDENAGFQLTNDWPWETDGSESRSYLYAVGISNSVRVVLVSILFYTRVGGNYHI